MTIYAVGNALEKKENPPATADERLLYIMSEAEFGEFSLNMPHRRTVLHCLHVPEYTKAQFFGSCIAGAVFVPDKECPDSEKARIGFYISERELFLIGDGDYTLTLAGRMKDTVFSEGMTLSGLFCIILNILIDDDFRFLQKTEKALIAMEDSLTHNTDDGFDVKIMPYRRLMMTFQSYYYQLMNMGMSMRANINNMLSEDDIFGFTCYSRRAEMLHLQVQTLRDYISHIREAYRTDIAVRQSKSMNMLTVVTSLFLPLSLIAGWYGMNFRFMPELSSPYGYPAVIAVSILIVVSGILYFKRKNLL